MDSLVEIPVDSDSWQLANAIQLAVFQLFDARDPSTARTETYGSNDPDGEPFEVQVQDPFDFDLTTFAISVNAVEMDQTFTIVASCDTK
jgi:hypothetical protein